MGLIGPQKRPFGLVCSIVGKSWLGYGRQRHHCDLGPIFSFYMDPPQPMIGSQCYLQVPQIGPLWGPTGERLAASGGHGLAEKWQFPGDL